MRTSLRNLILYTLKKDKFTVGISPVGRKTGITHLPQKNGLESITIVGILLKIKTTIKQSALTEFFQGIFRAANRLEIPIFPLNC